MNETAHASPAGPAAPHAAGRASGDPEAAHAMMEVGAALVADEMQDVEAKLAEAMTSPVGPIPRVGEHLLGAGGKRLRPLLAVLAARATDAPVEVGVAVGCAAELIHSATLFHDDVVDDGRVRRGRPAARMVYGNGIVVLVGDFCLARALSIATATGHLPVMRSLAATVTEMAEGEVAQLERAGDLNATIEGYHDVIDRKTGSLIAWCARVGDVLPPALGQAMSAYGKAVGRAFQIADDILDCAVDEGTAGKSVGRDLMEGKLTLPVLLAADRDAKVRQALQDHMTDRGVGASDAPRILRLVRDAEGVELARAQARKLVQDALAALGALPATPYKSALGALARLSVERVV